jgi:hypothetical protein
MRRIDRPSRYPLSASHFFHPPETTSAPNRQDRCDPPPVKWSDSKYGFLPEEDSNGEEETQA